MNSEKTEDLPMLLKEYMRSINDFVKKLKGGYTEEELDEEKQRIVELRNELDKRNRGDVPGIDQHP